MNARLVRKGRGRIEYQWHDGFFMENANLLKAPGYDVVNVNVHYNREFGSGPLRSLMAYFEIATCSTKPISRRPTTSRTRGGDTGDAGQVSGSIYAGAPRTYYGGFKVRF